MLSPLIAVPIASTTVAGRVEVPARWSLSRDRRARGDDRWVHPLTALRTNVLRPRLPVPVPDFSTTERVGIPAS